MKTSSLSVLLGLFAVATCAVVYHLSSESAPEPQVLSSGRDSAPASKSASATAQLEALRQVQQEITTSGVTNPLLHQRAQEHLIEWQQQLSRTPSVGR